jgi:hypothetical protein
LIHGHERDGLAPQDPGAAQSPHRLHDLERFPLPAGRRGDRHLRQVGDDLDAADRRSADLRPLEAQRHRRFVKTHTPLDGLPLDPRATYVVVARHPLDMAVSLYHQGANIDRRRLRELTGVPEPTGPEPPRPDLHTWLRAWTERETTPQQSLDSLVGVLHHVTDAWRRRESGEVDVLLVHYADLLADLGGEMRRVAAALGIEVDEERWPVLVEAATFASMRQRSNELTPNTLGVLKDSAAFFRRGESGAGREVLTAQELARYEARVRAMAPPEVVAWLNR